jgi:hypothetical protein
MISSVNSIFWRVFEYQYWYWKNIDILTLKKEDFWGKKWSMILILDEDNSLKKYDLDLI